MLRCDNDPEFACAAVADWAGERVGLHFIPPGQPWRNGYIESFNSRVRDECLNINMFWSLVQARVVISDWKADYTTAGDTPRSATRRQLSTLQAAPIHDRLSLTAAPMSRASGRRGRCILRASGGPVDLDRYPPLCGLRVDQVKRCIRAGGGE